MIGMTEKRFHIINGAENLAKYGIFCKPVLEDEETGEQYILALDLMDLLNALHEENEHYKALFFEIVETALTDKNCRELYCKGILNIFDKANSLNQARDMIKEYLE